MRLLPEQYWVRNIDHIAPHYVVFFTEKPAFHTIIHKTYTNMQHTVKTHNRSLRSIVMINRVGRSGVQIQDIISSPNHPDRPWKPLASYSLGTEVFLRHGSSTRDPPSCIIWPATMFVNYVYTTKITQNSGG
jgi:hypothetical protein